MTAFRWTTWAHRLRWENRDKNTQNTFMTHVHTHTLKTQISIQHIPISLFRQVVEIMWLCHLHSVSVVWFFEKKKSRHINNTSSIKRYKAELTTPQHIHAHTPNHKALPHLPCRPIKAVPRDGAPTDKLMERWREGGRGEGMLIKDQSEEER